MILHVFMSMPEGDPGQSGITRSEPLNPPSSEIGRVNLELPGRSPLLVRAVDADISHHSVDAVMLPSCVPLIRGNGLYEAAIREVAGSGPFAQADTFLLGRKEGQLGGYRYRVGPGEAFATGSGGMSKNGVNSLLFSFVTFPNVDRQWEMPNENIAHGVRLAMFKAEDERVGATSLAVPLVGYGVAGKELDTVLGGIEEGIGRYIGTPIPFRKTRLGRLDILAPNPTEDVKEGLKRIFQNLQRLAA